VIRRLPNPVVHGTWSQAWWDGKPEFTALFGQPPSARTSSALTATLAKDGGWIRSLRDAPGDPVDPASVVVLAGQQPGLGGGPLLVPHKAATAVAYARALQSHIQRPVTPVFLLATQDHDSSEVDHLDLINPSNGQIERIRCALQPQYEMLARSSWEEASFDIFKSKLRSIYGVNKGLAEGLWPSSPAPEHAALLLQQAFSGTGLRFVEAHQLRGPATAILDRALAEPELLAEALQAGATLLNDCGFPSSFDPSDPRPLVLESRNGRRKRVEAGDKEAQSRLADNPADFSPHAALRPIVQAATLPVVAQVCGPSEILYLGQVRPLHALFELPAPQLVPRLEATRVQPEEIDLFDTDLRLPESHGPLDNPLAQLLASLAKFRTAVTDLDSGLAARADRFAHRSERDARALAEAPEWRGRSGRAQSRLRPRGQSQDAVLSWLPEAFGPEAPPLWAEHIIGLSQPFEPPAHILHAFTKEAP